MRLRTLLIWLAVVPTVAMGAQTVLTADRLLAQSAHLRADVEAGERIGEPLIALMAELQAERTATAARWAGSSAAAGVPHDGRAATDRAVAEFHRLSAGHRAGHRAGSEHTDQQLGEVTDALDGLAVHRERADSRSGDPEKVLDYYTDLVGRMIRLYQDEFSHAEDAGLTSESRPVVAMLSASEMVAREDALLALAGPSRELTPSGFAAFLDAVGAHRYLYDTSIVPYLTAGEGESYQRIIRSDAWQTKLRIEEAILSDHKDIASGVKLPAEVAGWPAAHEQFAARLRDLNTDRSQAVLTHADAKASELQSQVLLLVGGSGGALLVVVLAVVLATRSMLRRLDGLHRRTVAIAERTLPDVVARLDRGQTVDESALPTVGGYQDEVGRISDAFARVVAVSVDGHRQLAAERHGFGMFASGIASRTGNLISRQLSLTEDLQDAFGHNEALLAQLMRSDQLTVGMRRQIENLLILSGGEIPDPHTEPMRVADLLREAAAEVEDFRRIERQALDEASVEPQVISQISHLLAELLDNAARFSPPRSKVVIRAELVADGLSVEIEDRGPRVTGSGYEEMNRRLHTAPPYAVLAENAHRLGLFVVGHLADQLGATVTLRRSVYGGTSAVVILPGELMVAAGRPEPERRSEREPVTEPTAAAVAPAAPESVPAPASVTVPVSVPEPVTGPRAAELVLHTGSRLPTRRGPEPSAEGKRTPALRPAPRDGDARPSLPERVPQTHMTEQLRGPRAPEPALGPDTATPEEVADAWADYEQGTQTVEAELRRDQP
ncbi:nitrate- and nitrite sensing domain-containing protein [Streptomyces sp. APSN-46.1]|uniref:sensor histidine kinase n=1 Tax=Streptomyces sp. APSN-46.1 TaxID=2929049 RepID=UPI001FB3B3B1|nr:sensor histidine kinase [Streptomyces sp. APSN-46.1]MCJ1676586.1 nitrate- and nitrite sensing domain-containing protein [Streptomyces sp. APSN-46.1]